MTPEARERHAARMRIQNIERNLLTVRQMPQRNAEEKAARTAALSSLWEQLRNDQRLIRVRLMSKK